MTTGEMVFYIGAGLLGLTVVLAIIFLIKRPRYVPEHVSHMPDKAGATQPLRSAYPTDSMPGQPETEALAPETPASGGQVTVPLVQGTVLLEQETLPLGQETLPLREEESGPAEQSTGQWTVPLQGETLPLE